MELDPIGTFHCDAQHPYDAPRQAVLAQGNHGTVELHPGRNFEQALEDLAGFGRIWLIYLFDRNTGWKPKVQPPRAARKVGVLASRAPYRPNPIGMSCVELLGVEGRRIKVGAHDLLDGTRILDIKPYIPYADSFPDAAIGWLAEVGDATWTVEFSDTASRQIDWIEEHGAGCVRAFLSQQLQERPFDVERKRVRQIEDDTWEIAYRTWRAQVEVNSSEQRLEIVRLRTGYDTDELARLDDPYGDKEVHRAFLAQDC